MQQFKGECLYGLAELKQRSPLLADVSESTVRNWVKKGIKVNGTTVRMDGVRVGKNWKSSLEAVERFFTAINPQEEKS